MAKTSKTKPSNLELFIRWFVVPLQTLKTIPNGDGAFIALSIGIFLCERYYRSVGNTQDNHNDYSFKKLAAKDLKVDKAFFDAFWDIFRNGMQHQATPKAAPHTDYATKITTNYKWRISGSYKAIPTKRKHKKYTVIKIDPWKFADSMVSKFLNNAPELDKVSTHSFGGIWPEPTSQKSKKAPPKSP